MVAVHALLTRFARGDFSDGKADFAWTLQVSEQANNEYIYCYNSEMVWLCLFGISVEVAMPPLCCTGRAFGERWEQLKLSWCVLPP